MELPVSILLELAEAICSLPHSDDIQTLNEKDFENVSDDFVQAIRNKFKAEIKKHVKVGS
jgi:hypothetical protein